jgi:DNA/RNA-binding protein KIN17
LIGEDPKRHIEDFSRLFLNNFLNLLKTTHGEKKVHINQFYQQVIADKEVSSLVGGMVVVADISSTFT